MQTFHALRDVKFSNGPSGQSINADRALTTHNELKRVIEEDEVCKKNVEIFLFQDFESKETIWPSYCVLWGMGGVYPLSLRLNC